MKCPNCGFNSFDYLSACKKCGSPLEVKPVCKVIYESIAEARRQKSLNISDEITIENEVVSGAVLPEPDLSGAVLLEPQSDSNSDREFPGSADTVGEVTGNEQSASLSIPYSEESPEFKEEAISFNLAGISSRARAFLIDIVLIFGITTLTLGIGLFIVNSDFNTRFMNVIVPLYFILLFLSSTYFVFLQGFAGKTIGKMIFGIRVIRDDGESIRLWDAFVRWLGYFISVFFIFIGFIWALFDSKSQAWHDKFAGTYVVKE